MTSRNVWDAMHGIDEKWILDAAPSQGRKKRAWQRRLGVGAMAAGLLLVVVLAVLWLPGQIRNGPPIAPDAMLWSGDLKMPDEPVTDCSQNFYGWKLWHGLDYALQNADEKTVIAMQVIIDLEAMQLDDFVYNGVSFQELREEIWKWLDARRLIEEFLREADALKYGELLYTTGTPTYPSYTKWPKEYYDERIAYYGEELIARYIKDREVQMALVNEDLAICETHIEQLCRQEMEHRSAFNTVCIKKARNTFAAAGAYAEVKNDRLYIFVTKEQLANLDIENKQIFTLYLANRALYDGTETLPPPID